MYGRPGVVGGATTVGGGVAALPNTGNNHFLMAVSIAVIALGVAAVITQIAVMAYRRRALNQL